MVISPNYLPFSLALVFFSRNARNWLDDGHTDGQTWWWRGLTVLAAHRERTMSSRAGADGGGGTQCGNEVLGYHQGVVDSGHAVTPGSSVPFPAAAGAGLHPREGQQQRWTLGVIQSGSSYTPICSSQTLILNTCWTQMPAGCQPAALACCDSYPELSCLRSFGSTSLLLMGRTQKAVVNADGSRTTGE